MRATVLLENLQKSLSFVNHAVSNRNHLPILSHILIEIRGEYLKICATDLEIGIETTIPATVVQEGSATIPAKLFLELINTLSPGKINLFLEDKSLVVENTQTKTVFQTMLPEEFPKLYDKKGEKIISIPAKSLQNTLKRTIFTASIDTTRPVLSGILFKKTEEGFMLVVTDGYRLSLEKLTSEKQTDFEGSVIVPVKLVREALLLKEEENVDIYIEDSQNQVILSQGETVMVGRLIDGEFPNYEKILPTDASTIVKTDKDTFLRAVKTSSVFARETANIITLTIKKEGMEVSSKTPSLGENTTRVEISLKGEENAIAFNARYLLDFLSIADTQEVIFEMTGPLNSGIFRLSGNSSYLHLIMPIRTHG